MTGFKSHKDGKSHIKSLPSPTLPSPRTSTCCSPANSHSYHPRGDSVLPTDFSCSSFSWRHPRFPSLFPSRSEVCPSTHPLPLSFLSFIAFFFMIYPYMPACSIEIRKNKKQVIAVKCVPLTKKAFMNRVSQWACRKEYSLFPVSNHICLYFRKIYNYFA